MKYLPSRRYAIFLVATILIVGTVLWSSKPTKRVAMNEDIRPSLATLSPSPRAGEGERTGFEGLIAPITPSPTPEELILGEKDARTELSADELRLDGAEDAIGLRAYGLALRDALAELGDQKNGDSLGLFVKAFDTAKTSRVPEILDAAARHDTTVANLLLISVPKNAQAMHLRLARSIAHREQLLQIMALVETAPVDALAASDQYIIESGNVLANLSEVNQYFIDHAIVFTKKEQGKVAITRYE